MTTGLSDTSTQGESAALAVTRAAPTRRAKKPRAATSGERGNAASLILSIPVRSIATIGRGAALGAAVLRYSIIDTLTLRLPIGEFLVQAWLLLTVTAIPAVLMAVPFGGMVSIVSSGLVNQMGASSLLGAASGTGVVRQGAPITAGLLMGGAAASAIASDFGARAIREELDALRVMGVDPVRRLVVPRFLALVAIAPILITVILVSGTTASYILAITLSDVTPGSFWQSFGLFAQQTDVWFAIIKTLVFAALVAIISSLRGIEATRGPRGVADAVSSSVVVNVIFIVIANLAITQLEVMFFPTVVA
ncbi:phospholipid/cholesterol/gamma-HCH transport system permease protein [Mycobacterium sp. OAS707]|uniref:ABC transporter permease n=1 Tax=Mycobacterium sp. OAS707 TaxID=2663822 RepID=UPI00178C0170|nr:ABC transporter permease [Mycobacterium sp. OAS707]MBE1549580.1 phospholipid/cholesterol/gamma-HCH transport system permease protein [Mycobacterium sp. OAS707]